MRVKLNGTVTSNSNAQLYRWFGFSDVCCPDDIRNAIESCPADEELVFEINSGGGSVYQGFEMYSVIRSSGREIVAEVQSIAGSAMSVVVSACNRVLMSPVANVMIHRASVGRVSGNAEDMEQNAQMLNTIDESILNAYCERVGDKCSRTKVRHMMENETFMTAQEAIDYGFADGIIGDSDEDAVHMAVASIDTNLIKMLVKNELPAIEDLQKMKAEMEDNSDQTDASVEVEVVDDKEKESCTMEFNTIDELRAAYPDFCNQIAEEARVAENSRINDIDAVALPGFEGIVAEAKRDPAQNAGTVAMAIIAEQKKSGKNYLAAVAEDVDASNVNDVEAVSNDAEATEEETIEQAAKAAVAAWKEAM